MTIADIDNKTHALALVPLREESMRNFNFRRSMLAMVCPSLIGCTAPAITSPVTVEDARTLSARQLGRTLLGPHLGERVIEVVRYESASEMPEKVELYSQPEMPWPRINGICSVDVVTVEYNWFELDEATAATPLKIRRVAAETRFKAVARPSGEPGSPAYERAHVASCADLTTATDAFRAPDAGDAQWLASIEQEYTSETTEAPHWDFSCEDQGDAACGPARGVLAHLPLRKAAEVESIECPPAEAADAVNYCYRLTFPYPDSEGPEWEIVVVGGMRTGSSPVQLRSLRMKHIPKPVVVY